MSNHQLRFKGPGFDFDAKGWVAIVAASFDRIFLVHMYHEVAEPYAFLWRLRPALVVLILAVTGWNGWTMVYRHGVGVQPGAPR